LAFVATQAVGAEKRAQNLGAFAQHQIMTIDAEITDDFIAGILEQANASFEGKETPYLLGHS
jgi:hypothetical protein